MTTLIFNDRGWTVCTNAWSVGSKPGKGNAVTVVYTWGADAISWFNSATGDASCSLSLTIEEFIKAATEAKGGVIDFRNL